MKWRYRFFLPLMLLLLFAAPASAQYMFLDTNGDGQHTSADVLAIGANAVNIYLDTNHNRDGSVATCDVDGTSPLTIGAYYVNLQGTNVTYSLLTNQMGADFSTHFATSNPGNGTLQDGYGSSVAPKAEGLYKLASLTITASAGASVNIVDIIQGSNIVDFTNFGTGQGGCFGNDFDNTYKLSGPGGGTDWHDVDGLTTGGPVNQAPTLTNPGDKTVNELALLSFTASATDPDAGQTLTFALGAGAPLGAAITSGGAFTWTPSEAQGPGTYPVTITVTDNGTPPLSDSKTFNVTVNEVNQLPVVTNPGNKTVNELSLLSFTASATDADVPAQTLTFSLAAGAPAGAAITAGGDFSWTPTEAQGPGDYPITINVSDGIGTGSAAFSVHVNEVNQAPVVTNPGNKTVNELALLSFTVTATDADLPAQTLTFSLAAGAPTGAAITAGGAFTWTPTEAQGPGDYPITVNVSDGTATGSAAFSVHVNEVNVAPVLNPIGNKSGSVGTPVTFTATATDADLPAQTLTFTLGAGAPAGSTINGSTGAFSWTPSASGSFPVTVIVTDNGTPNLNDSEAITINVASVNNPPVLAAIGNKTVNELSLLSFTATATDPDAGTTLTFTLDAGAPAGAAITTGGAFTWTPTEAQGPGVYPITVRVSDGSLDDFETINVTVNEVNVAPVVTNPGNKTVNELALLSFTVTATDADIPAQTITFSLGAGAPAGAAITAGGAFTWTPTEAQGPGDYPVTVIASDGTLQGSAAFSIHVNEVNTAPVVANPGDKTVNELALLSFTVTATDADVPANTLTFSLGAGAPAGAAITAGGAFTWTPTEAQGPGVYPITVNASDGTATGSATFNVTVNEVNQAPVLNPIGNKSGVVGVAVTFTATATDADLPAQTLTFSLGAGAPAGATINGSTGAFSWTPSASGSFPVTVIVTDNGPGTLTDSETISIDVAAADNPPVLAAIGNKTVNELSLLSFTATATDADLDPLTFSLDAGAPAGAAITTGGAFTWTPTEAQGPGVYPITVRVSDGTLSDFETINVTVNEVNSTPVLNPIGDKTVDELSLLSFTATATDADLPANTLTFNLGGGAPAGAAITAGGAFTWTPTEAQGPGVYPITIQVQDGTTGAQETINVTVNEVNAAPVLAAIGNKSGAVGNEITFTATATDSDIPTNTLTFSLDAGAPAGATIDPTTGVFSWTPSAQGTFSVTVRVTDNGTPVLDDFETISINVGVVNVAPVLVQPSDMTVNEGQTQTQQLSASDGNGDPLTYSLANGPAFVTVSSSGLVTVSPGFADAGIHPVQVSVSDGSLSDAKTFQVTVVNVNQAPTANAGGPYTGTINVAVSFNGTGSSDPDGDALSYAWDFGDSNTGSGATTSHAYTTTGTFTVTLTVSDGFLSDSDTTTASIVDFFSANAFFIGGNKTTRLGSGKPTTCVQIESVGDSFVISDVDLTTITMSYQNNSISAIQGKTSVDGDKNNNGIQEIEACFSKDDLRILFAGVTGSQDVQVTIRGSITTGGSFVATASMHIVGGKNAAVTAMAYPNPLNPETNLEFRTSQDGPVKVSVFDLQGRLVKTLQDGPLAAGYNSVRWDGRTQNGAKVASGVYYFKISAVEGSTVVRVTVLK